MIYKVNDNEHFNLTLTITPKEPGGCKRAEIDIHVILMNKKNGKSLKEWFSSACFEEALKCYHKYEDMIFSEREDVK